MDLLARKSHLTRAGAILRLYCAELAFLLVSPLIIISQNLVRDRIFMVVNELVFSFVCVFECAHNCVSFIDQNLMYFRPLL